MPGICRLLLFTLPPERGFLERGEKANCSHFKELPGCTQRQWAVGVSWCFLKVPVPLFEDRAFPFSRQNLWICLICGHIGCGRYVSRHAYKHFEETQHTYAMQLTNHRVWDYAGGERCVFPPCRMTLVVKTASGTPAVLGRTLVIVCLELKGFASVLILPLLGTSISPLIAVFVGL